MDVVGSRLLNCEVCLSVENAKYKCPKCYIKYCSILCWKEHTNRGCTTNEDNKNDDEKGNFSSSVLFPTDDTVMQSALEELKNNKELKKTLSNPGLRNIIEAVDKAKYVKSAIQQAMLEPIFVEFADQCLAIVDST